jgi:molybdopterin synthase catalytic subunit
VVALEYEAYEGPAVERIGRVVAEARRRWPAVARIAILHRVGRLSVTEDAVVVVVSSPHRAEAFGAAEFCIDTVKETAPIWKRERWATGEDWGICDHDVRAPVAGHPAPAAGSVGIPRAGVPAARDGG